jgi:hypothetical protein
MQEIRELKFLNEQLRSNAANYTQQIKELNADREENELRLRNQVLTLIIFS